MQLIREWFASGWSAVLVVFGLGLVIFIHEFGHFLMAKKNKVRVEIFSLGFAMNSEKLILWRRKWGETEYRICAIPLGGYVKMAGETLTDERKGDPGELTSKTPWQRFQIFVAGVIMNFILAFPIAIGAHVVGKYEHSNVIGQPGIAERRGGLLPGDEIIEVEGRKIESLDKFRIEMIRRPTRVPVRVKFIRNGKQEERTITTEESDHHNTMPASRALKSTVNTTPIQVPGVQDLDEIIAIDGTVVVSRDEMEGILRDKAGKDAVVRFQRRSPDFNDPPPFERTLHFQEKTWYVVPPAIASSRGPQGISGDDSLSEAIVEAALKGTPAYGVLEPGDRIKSINGREIRSWQDLREMVEPATPDTTLRLVVARGDETKELTLRPTLREDGKGMLGIGRRYTNVFAHVEPGSYFGRMGVKSGDVLYSVEGLSGNIKIAAIMGRRKDAPFKIPIKVKRGPADPIPIDLVAEPRVEADLAKAGLPVFSETGVLSVLLDEKIYRKRPFGEAVAAGVREPYDLLIVTFDMLRKLAFGQESTKNLSGPIGIINATYSFAQLSFGNYLWLLCLITVNLGVFNLLPVPLLDGGHVFLLGVEVVRKWLGKPPPSERFVAGFQWTGLVLLGGLLILVIYNDLARIITRG